VTQGGASLGVIALAPSLATDIEPPAADALFAEVFDTFPDGIVIVDRSGRIVATNGAADQLLTIPHRARSATCCDLFGCRRRNTALAGACVTEMVVEAGEPVSEIVLVPPRLSLTSSELSGPVRITAIPLEAAARIVYKVGPARFDDGPRRPRGRQLRAPRLEVRALGPLEVTAPTGRPSGQWVNQRAGQLFKFLVSERHRTVPREAIADAVWPKASFNTSNTVRHCMHILRSNLEPDVGKGAFSPYIVAEKGGYRLNTELVRVDVDEFERAISEGRRALAGGDSAAATAWFEAAVEMYRGEYLADEPYAEWALLERQRLHDLAAIGLRALAELCSHDAELALGYLERLAEMEPFDHEIQRQLITLLVANGWRSRAARHYQVFEQRSLRTFGEHPSFRLSDVRGGSRVQWERPVMLDYRLIS
jgi:DNA-binding SARP family transcriptional activator